MEPSAASEYVNDQEYMECVKDILEHPVFQSMDQYIQHGTTTCKDHCIQVSYLGYQFCKRFGGNWRSAARAGLLHDLFLYDWHTHARETGNHFHGFTHPRAALVNAEKYFVLSQEEKDIILRHMWPLTPVPPSTRAGFAITCADKAWSTVETVERIVHWLAFPFMAQPVRR
ncbi:HD family phosphohydrolase [Lacrimispora sp. 210928-DFI.3.58]|uniref:HD family phosphohydrolase n=1 Tax=Lacrimispora sp. 210928-DFI.3.58 TaxID=2883214 RepID=UPI0015B750BB|nr:HD family phosphohydrolase [Lacrimispora sp. 210928-DFI.3.58]MCB7317253.1 HD family phosphohydrolase [Lacrimispora sp. 210928-DFI.3.58]